jgi:predicted nucleic acid-binding protein
MPAYYFDTSALAKRYVEEVGSAWVQALVAQQSGQTTYTSVLTQPELVSALQRRVREGLLEALEAQRLAQQVLEHMTILMRWRRSRRLSSRRPVRCCTGTRSGPTMRCIWHVPWSFAKRSHSSS